MRINGWESVLRRIAAYSKCYLYIHSDVERMEDCRVDVKIPGPSVKANYIVSLGFMVSGNMAYPMMVRLHSSVTKNKTGIMKVLSEKNFIACTLGESNRSLEIACRNFLKSNAGKTLGVLDMKKPKNVYGYTEEIFTPIVEMPEFESLSELNIRISAMGM